MKRAGFLKALRILLFSLVGLILLAALILTEEYFRGKYAWEKYQREAEGRGVSFDPRPFIPPPVPDDQNFAMTPLLKPLFGTDKEYKTTLSKALEFVPKKENGSRPIRGGMNVGKRIDLAKWKEYFGEPDLLNALQKFNPEFDEISLAVRRPYARFPIPYTDGISADVSHLGPLLKLAQLYSWRALAFLEAGQPDRALEDAKSIFRLAESVRDEPLLISQLVRVSILSIGLNNVIWEGLESHRWSENQLAELQRQLVGIDLFSGTLRSNQFERAILPESMHKVLSDRKAFAGLMSFTADPSNHGIKYEWEALRLLFKSTLDQNMLFIWRFDEEYKLPAIDPFMRRVDVNKIKSGERKITTLRGKYNPYTFMALLRSSAVFPIFLKAAYAQTTVDQAVIVCALERYRLAHGAFPDTLDVLVPQYITKLPHDVINGQPLHYRRTDDGLFVLYSVGWNETDDNGTIAMTSDSKRQDIKEGDWVWPHAVSVEKSTQPK